MFARIATALLFTATAALAGPTITSVTPNIGPVAGGTVVTIKGAGFSNNCPFCSPPAFDGPFVFFGGTQAASVQFIDSATLTAVTPPELPSTVTMTLKNVDGSGIATLANAFSFQGDPDSAFDPVLFPLFKAPVQGQFGSQFQTTVRLSSKELLSQDPLLVYGIDANGPLNDFPHGPFDPFFVTGSEAQPPLLSQATGRVLYVAKGTARDLAASIRVTDVTRQAASFGVDVPVVRVDDFDDARLVFMGVPADTRFRCTLRLYSLRRADVPLLAPPVLGVTVNGKFHQVLLKHANDSDIFDPAYLEFTDFPALGELPLGQTTFRIVVDTLRGPEGVVIHDTSIWGMVSVTNNDTQQITIIRPN